jgi:hypothetical protein
MVPMVRQSHADNALTVDHILPRARGGTHTSENLRPMCKLCNQSLAHVGNCLGALACARAVMGYTPQQNVLRWWRGVVADGKKRARQRHEERFRYSPREVADA